MWHDHDGDWQFSCGTIDPEDVDSWVTLHVHHVLERDPTLHSLGALEVGWAAYRDDPSSPWDTEPYDEDS